ITTDGDKSSLTIDKAEPSHSGKLTVVTVNEAGTVESSSQITVTPKSTAPQITEGPKSVTISEKETAEFKVKVNGYPEPDVKWLINDKVVEESSTVKTCRFESEYSLRITEATYQFQRYGRTSIGPTNIQESSSHHKNVKENEQLQLSVTLDTPQPNTTVTWYVNGKEMQESPDVKIVVEKGTNKPEFTKTPQNHDVYTDEDSVKFSAIVTGVPTPKITWYLNDKKIESSEEIKVKFEEETGKTSIRIYKPQISQSGTVRVTAENSAGSAEAKATLKVDRRAEVPKFTSNLDDRQVKEGDTVKYTSTVEGYPEPTVEWLLNGEPVSKHA
ncbi:immunoglobulin I-set domain protein, partial [Cooperia oncophora]